jgi:chemotaxis protein CheX
MIATPSQDRIVQIADAVWTTVIGSTAHPGRGAQPADFTVRVPIDGAWVGDFWLRCREPLARRAASAFFEKPESEVAEEEMRDALGELGNMIGGYVKALLPGPSRLAVPQVIAGEVVPGGASDTLVEVPLESDGSEWSVAVSGREAEP